MKSAVVAESTSKVVSKGFELKFLGQSQVCYPFVLYVITVVIFTVFYASINE